MKSFLFACITVLGLAFVASYVLNGTFQQDSTKAFTTEGARLTPGEETVTNN
jgi:hypothetical protein